jgi:hypothetical protein
MLLEFIIYFLFFMTFFKYKRAYSKIIPKLTDK